MSAQVTPVHPPEGVKVSSVNSAATVSTDTVTAGAIAQTYSRSASASTTVSSLEDLRKKDPKLYNMMMQGIAMDICRDMQHHQDRLKEVMRKASEDNA